MKAINDMQTYVGAKIINAKPMTHGEYREKYGNFNFSNPEAAKLEGYLVEYTDGGTPNTSDYAGYVSWSPKDVFERCYRQIDFVVRKNHNESI